MSQNNHGQNNQNNQQEARAPRAFETRDNFIRPTEWKPPDILPMPKEHPDWVFRYIRTSTLGEDDPTNIHRSRREGFEPCRAADHPEIAAISDGRSRFPDNIEIGGLLLCRAPREFMEQRKKYYETQTRNQQHAIDNNMMKEQDGRSNMEILPARRRSKVTFGSGDSDP